MAIAIFDTPIPVIVNEDGTEIYGYAMYVESGGMYENDSFTVVHTDTGIVRHYLTSSVRVHHNGTYGIKNPNEKEAS